MSLANGIIDIDHLMVHVSNLDGAAQRYLRLGFFVCPPRRRIGMAAFKDGAEIPGDVRKATLNNRHIIFKPYPGRTDVANFLEFMCNTDPFGTPPAVTQFMSFLGDSEGPKTIVCLARDIDASVAEFRRRGFEIPRTIPFETGWDDVERSNFVRIQARPFVPVAGQMPFHMNCYETSTLEGYQYTPWTTHPNTAKFIARITGVSENLKDDVEFMASRIFDVEPRWVSEDVALLQPRDISLRIVSPKGFDEIFPNLDYSSERLLPHTVGLTFVVERIEVLKAILDHNGVRSITTPAGICVPRQEACNTLLEFTEQI